MKELDLKKYQELLSSLNNEATWEDVASLVSQHFTAEECFILGMQTAANMTIESLIMQTDKTIN